MKISYHNTALRFLEDAKNFPIHLPDEFSNPMTSEERLRFEWGIREQFSEPGFAKLFSKNIQYVTQPFYKAYWQSRYKIKEVVQNTAFEDSGTLIIPWPNHVQTFFYVIRMNGDKENWDYEIMLTLFTRATGRDHEQDSFGLDLCIYIGKEEKQFADIVWKGFTDQGRDQVWWLTELMCFKTFLKFAEVQTKIVNGKRKEVHLGEKYLNDTNRRIEILDSTYFTTISRTEGFGVKGHFRLQPWGPGLCNKRLQWISDFEKHGYTRKAKILSQ